MNDSKTLRVVALAIIAGCIAWVALAQRHNQWDFEVYYASAKALLAGKDPYSLADRQEIRPGVEAVLPLVYAPLTVWFFVPFALFPWKVAYELWLLAKLAALFGLARVWSRAFGPLHAAGPTLLFFWFAFSSPLFADLASGNPALFAELLLWWGFAELLQGRSLRFSLAVAGVAYLKISPLFFAALPLILVRRRWLAAAGPVAGFAALMGASLLLYPRFFTEYLAQAAQVDERGANNASTLSLIRDLVPELGWPWRPIAPWVSWLVFGIVAAAILAWSLRAVIRYRRGTPAADDRVLLLFSCTVFALLAPRLKTYGCTVLLVPAWHLLQTSRRRETVPLLLCLFIFPIAAALPLTGAVGRYLHEYGLWLGAFVLWWLYCRELSDQGQLPPS